MDSKITLSFDRDILLEAKKFASRNNISLSRLTEFIYRQMTSKNYSSLDELPISDWINMVADHKAEYRRPRSRKKMKSEFFDSKKATR